MGEKAFHISLDELFFSRTDFIPTLHHFSKIGGMQEIAYLKIILFNMPDNWTILWEIRKIWFNSCASEEEVAEYITENMVF